MGRRNNDKSEAEVIKAPPIAHHRKKLGDREAFEAYDRKAARRSQHARDGRRSQAARQPLSAPALAVAAALLALVVACCVKLIVALLAD
mmetsp:Transcript_22570/g.67220  ORF Transcript_22570/g.67220 Transcript_22570/m.67220 type:complete len:89 (-) Transcript_22570:3237-3503(-)